MFWSFGPETCGILAPRPGIEPASPALEGEVLTTGPPGKSLSSILLNNSRIKEETTRGIRKYFSLNNNEDTVCQTLCHAGKAALRGQFTTLSVYIRKDKKI